MKENNMKYAIMHDFEDDCYYLTNFFHEYATELKVYESDSLHDCFEWAFANDKCLYPELHNNEDVWCVCIYWDDFSKNFHICPEKDVRIVDDVCFRGSEQECNEWYNNHCATKENNMDKKTSCDVKLLKDSSKKITFDDVITLFPSIKVIEVWRISGTNVVYEDSFTRYVDMELYGEREVSEVQIVGMNRIKIILKEEK